MKIHLLGHSGFWIETEELCLVFDAYRDEKNLLQKLEEDVRSTLFCVSHEHEDHWNPELLDRPRGKRKAVYALVDSACTSHCAFRELSLHRLKPGQEFTPDEVLRQAGLLRVLAGGSTDCGLSFALALQIPNREEPFWIFHAGDLNDWDWQDSFRIWMHQAYQLELQRWQARLPECLDLVFLPVDQRLGARALAGAEGFLEFFRVRHLVPMHLWGGKNLPGLLQEQVGENCTVHALVEPGDSFEIF